jgi:broad specificity phosphatase PhoE
MLEVLLIRPGSTTFDQEGRIKGSLDIPLSEQGEAQAEVLSKRLAGVKLDCLYVAPCESAKQSADRIADRNFCKQKTLDCLRNLNHGLWQGKLVSEVKRLQPKVYRQFQEHPTDVCPPGGETVQAALERVKTTVDKLKKRHNGGRIGLLVPQPMASIMRFALVGGSFGDLWQSELDFGTFETLAVEPTPVLSKFSILAAV